MTYYQICSLIGFILCFASFTWAIKYFFTSDGAQKGMQAIKFFGAIFAIFHLFFLIFDFSTLPFLALVAQLFYLLSLFLFWWTIKVNKAHPLSLAYSLDEPIHLVNKGPYAFIRHPFYTAYLFFWFSGVLASSQWWLLFTVVIMFYLYITAAKFEEDKFLNSNLKDQYQVYKEHTGMFLPFKISKRSN